MSSTRRSFLRRLAMTSPLPLLPGCRGFIENLDTSAGAEGTGFQGSAFFLSYRVVRVQPYADHAGTRPEVTPKVVRKLKAEQDNLQVAALQGRKEIPKTRARAETARRNASGRSAQAKSEPDPRKQATYQSQAAEQTNEADKLEQQAADFENKVKDLLAAANAEIGTILANDALHEVHIPSGTLTDTVYIAPDELEDDDLGNLIVQSDTGSFPVIRP